MAANITKMVVYRATLLSLLLLSVNFVSDAQTPAQSGTSPSDGKEESQLLSILIDEVHNLRLTLEQNSLLQHRSNLLLARIRRQEDLIRETKGEIRTLDNDMVDLADGSRYDDENDDLQDIETQINETTDLPTRLELVHEYAGIKRRLDRQKQSDKEQLERKRDLKPKLEDKVREEETVLMDLNSQLDAFELDIQLQMKTAMSQSGVQIKRQ